MTVGQRIKAERKAKGMTQEDLGKKLGVSGAAIAQYETGRRYPKVETLERIATALNVDVSKLSEGLLDLEEKEQELVRIRDELLERTRMMLIMADAQRDFLTSLGVAVGSPIEINRDAFTLPGDVLKYQETLDGAKDEIIERIRRFREKATPEDYAHFLREFDRLAAKYNEQTRPGAELIERDRRASEGDAAQSKEEIAQSDTWNAPTGRASDSGEESPPKVSAP